MLKRARLERRLLCLAKVEWHGGGRGGSCSAACTRWRGATRLARLDCGAQARELNVEALRRCLTDKRNAVDGRANRLQHLIELVIKRGAKCCTDAQEMKTAVGVVLKRQKRIYENSRRLFSLRTHLIN